MKIAEAIKILDPETTRDALRCYAYDPERRVKVVNEACKVAADALRAQYGDNTPLTFEELRGMDGQPVWDNRQQIWGLIDTGLAIVVTRCGDINLNVAAATGRLYRRKPTEEDKLI